MNDRTHAQRAIDRRAARARAKLHEALCALIAEKGYESITVEDICGRADTSRSTFYAHYAGKDDLMRGGFDQLRDLGCGQQNFGEAADTPGDGRLTFSLHLLQHARDHYHLHKALGERGEALARERIREIVSELIRRELMGSSGNTSKGGTPRELAVQYVVGAYMSVIAWWLERGARLPPERVDALLRRLVTQGLVGLT